jgi:hypothetical protein
MRASLTNMSKEDPFARIFGARAGVASPEIIFEEKPGPEARKQYALVLSAIQSDDYDLALSALSYAYDAIEEHEIPREIRRRCINRVPRARIAQPRGHDDNNLNIRSHP